MNGSGQTMSEAGTPEHKHLPLLEAGRLRGERLLARMRIGAVLFASGAFLLLRIFSPFRAAVLDYLYAALLGAAALCSIGVLRLPNWREHPSALAFVCSFLDISAVSGTILIVLVNSGRVPLPEFSSSLLYGLYFPVILISIRRYCPASSLLAGALAALQYPFILLYRGPMPNPLSPIFESLLLLLSGILAFALARNAAMHLRAATRTVDASQVQQAYLNQFFDNTPEAIVLSDTETRILRINTAFSRLFGYSEEEAIGRRIDDLVAPEHLQSEAAELSEAARRGSEFLIETVRRRKEQGLVDVSILGAPIFFQGRQVAIFGIYRDVTERKRKERLFYALNRAALATQEALTHQQIIDAVASVLEELRYNWDVLLLDDGGRALRVEYIGFPSQSVQAVERLLGIERSEVRIPIDCHSDLLAVAARGETRFVADSSDLVRALLPGPLRNLASRLVDLLGITRTIGAPLMQEGSIIGLLAVHSPDLSAEDTPALMAFANQLSAAWQKVSLIGRMERNIVELQETQAQLIQAQKMEAVGRLAGGVAHDFNNLLTVIRGYSELLLNEFALNASARETVQEIRKAGEQASQLTGHLLAFSRKQMSIPRIVNVNDAVRSMEKLLQRLIGEDMALRIRLDEQCEPIRIDPYQLEQVIMNLAVNARDAMPGGGSLYIETANVHLGPDFTDRHPEVEEGPYVLVAVSDTGSGIDEGILPQIFEPFFTTKERGRGTGLGLSTVYGIVKQALGYVYGENTEAGAKFTLYFPPSRGKDDGERDGRQSDAGLEGSETVLLVEDEETVRRLTRSILERSGYVVLSVASGEEAASLEEERLEKVEVLITDVVMPGMNGRALARKLQARFPDLKVLFFSGYAADVAGGEIAGEQGGQWLQKPFSRVELLKKLRQVLGQ